MQMAPSADILDRPQNGTYGGPLKRGQNQKWLPVPSRGPKRGRNCYVTHAFSGVSRNGDKIRSGYITHAFPGAQDWAELLHNPCILGT